MQNFMFCLGFMAVVVFVLVADTREGAATASICSSSDSLSLTLL